MLCVWLAGLLLAALSPSQMQEITTLLQRGELTQALTLLEPLSKRHPADPIIAGLLGRADSTQETPKAPSSRCRPP